eukprot:364418-Chlamydomonas_euryale.AAC.23
MSVAFAQHAPRTPTHATSGLFPKAQRVAWLRWTWRARARAQLTCTTDVGLSRLKRRHIKSRLEMLPAVSRRVVASWGLSSVASLQSSSCAQLLANGVESSSTPVSIAASRLWHQARWLQFPVMWSASQCDCRHALVRRKPLRQDVSVVWLSFQEHGGRADPDALCLCCHF